MTSYHQVEICGIIEVTFDEPFGSGFKVHGPADDDRYTVRHIKTKELATQEADRQAQRKANDLGEKVSVESYIDREPIRQEVVPSQE